MIKCTPLGLCGGVPHFLTLCFSQNLDHDASASDANLRIDWLRRSLLSMKRMKRIQLL